jgi:hypothetical protein
MFVKYATHATLVQGDLKRKTSLPHGDIEQGRQHYGGHQVRTTNHVKTTCNTQGNATCCHKTTKWKSEKEV